MELIITKKAQKIINSFSNREKDCYEYILQLLKSDSENFKEVNIAQRAGDDPEKVKQGFKIIYRLHDRACYILQTLGIHASLNENILTISEIKS